jgi:hypothetical protein
LSWASFLAPNYDDRTKLLTLRELMSLLGMFTVIAIPAIVEINDLFQASKHPVKLILV